MILSQERVDPLGQGHQLGIGGVIVAFRQPRPLPRLGNRPESSLDLVANPLMLSVQLQEELVASIEKLREGFDGRGGRVNDGPALPQMGVGRGAEVIGQTHFRPRSSSYSAAVEFNVIDSILMHSVFIHITISADTPRFSHLVGNC